MATDIEEAFSPMFCYQCEQAMGNVGCSQSGRCGKSPRIAYLQDSIIAGLKSLCVWLKHYKSLTGKQYPPETVSLISFATFQTLTNVNFNEAHLLETIQKLVHARNHIRQMCEEESSEKGDAPSLMPDIANWTQDWGKEKTRIDPRMRRLGPTVTGLQEVTVYGIKGIASYLWHILRFNRTCEHAVNFIVEAFATLAEDPTDVPLLLDLAMRAGQANFETMKVLDSCHTETYGHPVPTPVLRTVKAGHCILVSGHDLMDLHEVLEATKDIPNLNVYTHGEMLPLSGYPGLKKYHHFVGHYGTAWQNQLKEFTNFPGAIFMTTNCLMPVLEPYKDRVFTAGPVGFPSVAHLEPGNLQPLIAKALSLPGFPRDETPEKFFTVGFAHHTVESVADKLVEAVKAGKIRRFFLVGGCDGHELGRNYYTELCEKLPRDTIVLTLACGKFRFNHLNFGEIEGTGIPRLLDCGQCNDAYSAIVIATLLSQAFNCGVHDLPLSIILSWFEQKAVAILLTLLSLGIQNIRIGPQLPAFFTPEILQVLTEKFHLLPIGTPDKDIGDALGAPQGQEPTSTSSVTAGSTSGEPKK